MLLVRLFFLLRLSRAEEFRFAKVYADLKLDITDFLCAKVSIF